VKAEKLFYFFLYFSFAAAFISISVYQASLALTVVTAFFLAWKKRINPFKGLFSIPLLGHLSVITLSSLLFLRVKEQWRRLIEQDFFSLSYFVGHLIPEEKLPLLVKRLIQITIIFGWLLSLKVLYTYYFQHDYKGFWGGNFVVGNLLALPTFGSLYFFLSEKGFWKKVLYLISGLLFLYVSFLPVERSVILGYLIGLIIFAIAFGSFYKKWKILLGILFLSLTVVGTVALQSPKVRWWIHLLQHPNKVEALNRISSSRILIAKGALELIEDAIKRGDYLKLLIGWGYGPQKQYKNLPKGLQFINEYESFVFLTEFINGGLLNLIFVLWFYLISVVLTVKVIKDKGKHFWIAVVLISSVWVNLGYHLFTLFWVPINGIFYILLGFVEKLVKKD
jgi:hypothetical protein